MIQTGWPRLEITFSWRYSAYSDFPNGVYWVSPVRVLTQLPASSDEPMPDAASPDPHSMEELVGRVLDEFGDD